MPFSFTMAELHDIDSWEKVRAIAPPQAYVTKKQLVGTPTRVDSVEADPACSFCNQPANSKMDETRLFCSQRCTASSNSPDFQPNIRVTVSFRFNFEGARKYIATKPFDAHNPSFLLTVCKSHFKIDGKPT
jgi:hypothetical protein